MNFHHATNLAHLKQHDEQLVQLGILAPRYFADAPNTFLPEVQQQREGQHDGRR